MKYERCWYGETKWERIGVKHLETALRQVFPNILTDKIAEINHGEEIVTPYAVYRRALIPRTKHRND